MPRLLIAAVAVLLALLAPVRPEAATAPATLDAPFRSVDRELARMGREIPGFGGLYYDSQGRPNVFLVDPAGAGATALKALGRETLVHRGEFEIERLLAWRRELRPVLAAPGIVYLDVDEATNRVVIGVDASAPDRAAVRQELEKRLLAAAIPPAAVVFREAAPLRFLTGLRDKLRPVPGGVQMVFSGFACTLGFSAFRGRDLGFVVASHCTDEFGAPEGTRFFQSLPQSNSGIGTEVADPPFFTGPPCPAGRRCRFSDSAFAKYDKAKLGGLGKVARPTAGGSALGSITLQPPTARFTLIGRAPSPLVGEQVHKVGRTTGWTFGNVLGTCLDVQADPDFVLFCQTLVQIGGGPGDSGSPVFTRLPGNKARLVGLLWGGGDDPNLGTVGIFSPLENIEEDLGPLRVF